MSSSSPLSSDQIARQVDHMVSFILKEADEKAQETIVKATEQFHREKAKKIREERQLLIAKYDAQAKDVKVKERIERSKAVNQSRLLLLQAREVVLQKVLDQAREKLPAIGDPSSDKYKTLIQDLITQALVKIEESAVQINCRKCDVDVVKSAIPSSVEAYKKLTGETVKVTIDETLFLLGPKGTVQKGQQYCSGGVVLTGLVGRIVCDNTLDQRLELAFEGLLPQVRGTLFGYSQNRAFYG